MLVYNIWSYLYFARRMNMNYDECLSKTSQADTEGHTFMMIARYLGLGFSSYI